jgi:HNH endonuclease
LEGFDLRVLVACEFSGTVRNAFLAAGHDARQIEGFPGYALTSDGSVWGCRTNKGFRSSYSKMTVRKDAKGYFSVILCNGRDKRRNVRIHRLIAETFVPNPANLPCVRHLDGNPANNGISNIAWGSYSENENDKFAHGTWHARYGGAKLSEDDRKKARLLAASGWIHGDIGILLGVSRPTISRLISGKTWGALAA